MTNWAVFHQNRAKFTLEDLLPYDGQWVAFSADGSEIVASAPTLDELFEKLRAASRKLNEVALESFDFEPGISHLGAAEFY